MSDLRKALEGLVNRWAVGGNGHDAESMDLISACSAELLRVLDEHPEDAPGNEPAKVIVVTEHTGKERRFTADNFTHGLFGLTVQRDAQTIAYYPNGTYLSVREDDAEAPGSPDLAFTPVGYQGAAAHTYTTRCDGFHPIGEQCNLPAAAE